jgi:hypothetical protein
VNTRTSLLVLGMATALAVVWAATAPAARQAPAPAAAGAAAPAPPEFVCPDYSPIAIQACGREHTNGQTREIAFHARQYTNSQLPIPKDQLPTRWRLGVGAHIRLGVMKLAQTQEIGVDCRW